MKHYTEKELMKKWPIDEIPDCVREFAVAWGSPFHLDIRDTVKLARDMLNVFEQLRGKPLLKPEDNQEELWDEALNSFYGHDCGHHEHLAYFKDKYTINRK